MTSGTAATRHTVLAPGATPARQRAWTLPVTVERESTRIVDALFGLVTMFRTLPGISAAIPVSDVVGILFIGVMLLRAPRYRLARAGGLIPGYVLMLAYLIVVSMVNDVDWLRRSVHITVLMMLALLVGTGRAHLPSLLRGAMVGLVANAVAFYAGLAPDNYGGNLTGYLEDKNHAALVIAVVGVTAAAFVRRRYVLPLLTLTLGGVWLTGSRTTLAALAMAGAWILLRPALPSLLQRLTLGGGIVLMLNLLVDDYSRIGVFSDRTGTDQLRQRIDEATSLKLESTPLYGGGLGTATVSLDDNEWFFHNAYSGLRQEGGWLLLIVFVGVLVWFGLRPQRRQLRDLSELLIEAAVIVELVCAWKLGEVFLSTQTYPLLAAALLLYLRDQPEARVLTGEEETLRRYQRP